MGRGLTRLRSAPASMSKIAASAWADSIARCSGVFPVPNGGETSGGKQEKGWLSTDSIGRVKPGLWSSLWKLQEYGNHPGRACRSSTMSVILYSRYDIRRLVVRVEKLNELTAEFGSLCLWR